MNIVANNCIGARLYQICNCMYNNPFMWCVIQPADFINLIEHFNDINFGRIAITPSNYYLLTEHYRNQYAKQLAMPYFIFKITIDGIVNIHYVHYRWSNDLTRRYIDTDVYDRHIWDYVVEKYINRTRRMINAHKNPTFICNCTDFDYTLSWQEKIVSVDTPYKLIMITDYANALSVYHKRNLKILPIIRPIGSCMAMATAHKDDILNF